MLSTTLIIVLIIVGAVIVNNWAINNWSTNEGFESPVIQLYKNWGNGGIRGYPPTGGLLRTNDFPPYYPPASTRSPENTFIDQLICKDYSERKCLGVRFQDRFEYCRSGEYDSCMDGRKKLVWETSLA